MTRVLRVPALCHDYCLHGRALLHDVRGRLFAETPESAQCNALSDRALLHIVDGW